MRKLKVIMAILSVLFILLFVGDQFMKRSIRRTNFEPLGELFKARLGEALTVPVSEPVNFKDDAKLLDTYKAATLVVNAATELRLQGKAVNTSAELDALSQDDRVDGWGNPFCLVEMGGRIAAVSGGPRRNMALKCNDLHIDLDELRNMPSAKLYQYPSGILVMAGGRPLTH